MSSSITAHSVRTSLASKVQNYDTQGFASSEAIKVGPCMMLSAVGRNSSASTDLYIMFFDAAAVPGNGATPMMMPIPVAKASAFNISIGEIRSDVFNGFSASHGLCWAASTTDGTLTLDTSDSIWMTVRFL